MTIIIVGYGAWRFGYVEKDKPGTSYTKNCRAIQIQQLQQELRMLRRQHKSATEEHKQPLVELRNIVWKKLMTLQRAEWHRRRGKERSRKRAASITNPFGFVKQLRGDKCSGHLSCSPEEVDRFLKNRSRRSICMRLPSVHHPPKLTST